MRDSTDEFSFVVRPSSLPKAGVGIFATHDIAAGTKLAINAENGESRVLSCDDVPLALRHFTIEFGDGKCKAPCAFNHLWIVWYLNHSDTPNIELRMPENNYYSLRDIRIDEELFTNYNSFEEPDAVKDEYYAP